MATFRPTFDSQMARVYVHVHSSHDAALNRDARALENDIDQKLVAYRFAVV